MAAGFNLIAEDLKKALELHDKIFRFLLSVTPKE